MVCRWALPAHNGGIPVYNRNLINALSKKIDFSIVSHANKVNKDYYRSINIPFHEIKSIHPRWDRLSKFNFLNKLNKYLVDIKTSNNMAKSLTHIKPHIAEFMDIHSESLFFIKQKIINKLNTKIIIRSHTPWGLLRTTYNKKELNKADMWQSYENEKFCYENCDVITVPSIDLKNKINNMYGTSHNKIYVLPNFVDTNFFISEKTKIRKEKKAVTLLHVGRFQRAKGVETLIKAFINLSQKSYNLELINIGEPRGDSYNKCVDWLKKKNLLHKVKFKGIINNDELPKYYNKSDIVIVPSEIYESFSYTVAQGMACSKPVVASKIGGIPETLNHGNCGVLFSPGDVEDLSNKIEILYFNLDLRDDLGKKARDYCESKFSIESLKSKYFKFYVSLLNNDLKN